MDALSDVLRVTRLTGGVFLDARFKAPWSIAGRVEPVDFEPFLAAPREVIAFHYVVEGRLLARVEDGEWAELRRGDLIMLPRNAGHTLASDRNLVPEPANEIVMPPHGSGIYQVEYGGAGEETHIVCGYLGSDGGDSLLSSSLPPMLTINVEDTPGGPWIAQSFKYAADQLAASEIGAASMIARLSELMFVEAVRRYIDTQASDQTGWFAGLKDPIVGKAMALLHTSPAQPWNTDLLAKSVNMSRSAFADRFTRTIGLPPMGYLTNWRMLVAKQKLQDTNLAIIQIALAVGYDSEAAFSRAFKRETGVPPATWRKQSALS